MHNQRFFSYLSLFTFMMVILVTANNYLLMFVGWEGVGVCSYLLVCFWFTRIAANQSSLSAFLTNRVGDCFLTIGMFAILWGFGKTEKMKVSKCEYKYDYPYKNNRSRSYHQIKRYYTTQIERDCSLGPYLAGLIEGSSAQKEISNSLDNSQPQFSQRESLWDPYFVTGFADAESCFYLWVEKSSKVKLGWRVVPRFEICLNKKDLNILQKIKSFFGIGNVCLKTNGASSYTVLSIKDLELIIDHFDKYPLITKKFADYHLFKNAFTLIKNKEHLTIEGLQKIVAIKASMNKGLSSSIKAAFPNIIPVNRPSVLDCKIKDPNWLTGFTTGEGCFLVRIIYSSRHRLGVQVQLLFKLAQHNRDEQLITNLVNYLDSGNISRYKDAIIFEVTRFSDLRDKVIPFFQKYPLQGVKLNDYLGFSSVIELINNKAHFTEKGLDQIRMIKSSMHKENVYELSSSAQEPKITLFKPGGSVVQSRTYVTRSILPKSLNSDDCLVNNNFFFASYLAGLIEGNGLIHVQDPNSNTKIIYRPKIIIVFNINDKPLAEKLSAELKVGKVINREKAGHVLLQILAKEEVLKIMNLINGYLRTAKIETLYRVIHWYNENDNTNIIPLPLDKSSFDSNAWLAGFSQNNSFFSMTTQNKKNMIKIILNFKLENTVFSKTGNESEELFYYFSLYSKISEYLETDFNTKIRHLPYTKCRFIVFAYGFKSKNKVIEYFSKYPLLGKVSLDYELWREIYMNKSQKENTTKSKALLNCLRIHQNNKFIGDKVNKNLNFYLPHSYLSNRRNYCTNYKILFKPRYYCTQKVKINEDEIQIALFLTGFTNFFFFTYILYM